MPRQVGSLIVGLDHVVELLDRSALRALADHVPGERAYVDHLVDSAVLGLVIDSRQVHRRAAPPPATGAGLYDRLVPERLLFEIDRRFKEEHEASRLGRRLREWGSDHPPLARFEDADSLVRFFRDRSIDYEPKDQIAGILCVLSRNDELAEILLLKLYFPGLISKRRRWKLDGRGLTRDEVDAALVAGLLDRAAKAQLEATEKLSGRLVAAGRNRARKEIRERTESPTRRVRGAKSVRSDPVEVNDVADEASTREAAAKLINRAHAEGGIRQNDAKILLARSVEKLSTRETAARFGVSEVAAKVRVHRARERLTRWLQADQGARNRSEDL